MGSLSRLESPSDLEARDRLAIDLIDGHIAHAARIAAIPPASLADGWSRRNIGLAWTLGAMALAAIFVWQAQRDTSPPLAPAARRVLDMASSRYEGGASTYLDVITAQQSLASGLDETNLSGGLRSIGVDYNYRHNINENWQIFAEALYEHFSSDVRNSPIARSNYEAEVGIGFIYIF